VPSPIAEYSQRLDARRAEQRRWSQIDARFASLRLAVFGLGILFAVLAVRGSVSAWILAVPVVSFALLMKGHDFVLRRRTAAARGVAFYQHGIARIEDVWVGIGEPGDRFRDDHHLYANDLDLFGNGSLFQLSNYCQSHRRIPARRRSRPGSNIRRTRSKSDCGRLPWPSWRQRSTSGNHWDVSPSMCGQACTPPAF
jgi:hypothetical protein